MSTTTSQSIRSRAMTTKTSAATPLTTVARTFLYPLRRWRGSSDSAPRIPMRMTPCAAPKYPP